MMRRRSPAAQRGDVMLVVLIFLMVCLFGLVVAMRGGLVTTVMTGNNLVRQKEVQVSDIALAQIENTMLTLSTGAGGLALAQIPAATAQAWWRTLSAPAVAPLPSYWGTCLVTNAGDATRRCGSIALTGTDGKALSPAYTALAVVQDTYRYVLADSNCPNPVAPNAQYYDVFLHVMEPSGATSIDTEAIFRLCVA